MSNPPSLVGREREGVKSAAACCRFELALFSPNGLGEGLLWDRDGYLGRDNLPDRHLI